VSALIAQLALAGNTPICEETMEIFVGVLGAETGNCALRYMTTGGIFIAGVIAAKNVEKLKNAAFLQAFLDKGRMSSLLKDMPIRVILNDDCGLIGSARYTLVQKAFGNKSASA
jgi:glucokinase